MEEVITVNNNLNIDPNSIKLPYILKNVVLMSPGIWNDTYYDSEAIIDAFKNTDWNDKEIRSLFYDHEDRKSKDWIGLVENPRLEGDKIYGDLYIYDTNAAIKVGLAKMKCGISPKVIGDEKNKRISNMKFLNFSIVTNPACKKAYINLSERRLDKMEENKAVSDQPVEVIEELKKKEEVKEEDKKEEMSDSEFTALISSLTADELSEYTDFVKAFLKKNKDASIKDAAKAYKEQKKMFEQYSGMSEEELIEQINCLTSILKKKKYPYPYPYEEKEKKMAQEINALQERIKELEQKLNTPEKKAVKSLSSETTKIEKQSMWDFLKANAKL